MDDLLKLLILKYVCERENYFLILSKKKFINYFLILYILKIWLTIYLVPIK